MVSNKKLKYTFQNRNNNIYLFFGYTHNRYKHGEYVCVCVCSYVKEPEISEGTTLMVDHNF